MMEIVNDNKGKTIQKRTSGAFRRKLKRLRESQETCTKSTSGNTEANVYRKRKSGAFQRKQKKLRESQQAHFNATFEPEVRRNDCSSASLDSEEVARCRTTGTSMTTRTNTCQNDITSRSFRRKQRKLRKYQQKCTNEPSESHGLSASGAHRYPRTTEHAIPMNETRRESGLVSSDLARYWSFEPEDQSNTSFPAYKYAREEAYLSNTGASWANRYPRTTEPEGKERAYYYDSTQSRSDLRPSSSATATYSIFEPMNQDNTPFSTTLYADEEARLRSTDTSGAIMYPRTAGSEGPRSAHYCDSSMDSWRESRLSTSGTVRYSTSQPASQGNAEEVACFRTIDTSRASRYSPMTEPVEQDREFYFKTMKAWMESSASTSGAAIYRESEKYGNTANASSGSYSPMVKDLEVEIILNDYSNTDITLEQENLIRRALLERLENINEGGHQPRFSKGTVKNGSFILSCLDQTTKEWVEQTVRKIVPWEGARLRVRNYREDVEQAQTMPWIPERAGESNSVFVNRGQSGGLKRIWADTHVSKRQKQTNEQFKSTKFSDSGSYAPEVKDLAVEIILDGCSNTSITLEQENLIRRALLERLEDINEGEYEPRFCKGMVKNGSLILSCLDQTTKDWIERTVRKIVPWDGARLRVRDYREDVEQMQTMAWISDPADEVISVSVNQEQTGDSNRICTDTCLSKRQERRHRQLKTKFRTRSRTPRVRELDAEIILDDYSNTSITLEQGNLIRRALLERLEDINEGGPAPRFSKGIVKNGSLILSCLDRTTKAWVERTVRDIVPWDGARLKLRSYRDVEQIETMAWIPGHAGEPESLMARLKVQNPGIKMENWKVIGSKVLPKGQKLFISMDPVSWKTVQQKQGRLYLNFTTICVKERKGQQLL
ncbi:unnamed protein product [Psylliodes chrysocephalus]|uniref:DUF4780 domain-containing protein n=1 Tax=Psylliodes chrysocephalus TaxID=3402493 RepID=A0A9P0CSV3_9CUCU|nr:unnamed protein product [Psylliodes chrysocephala]